MIEYYTNADNVVHYALELQERPPEISDFWVLWVQCYLEGVKNKRDMTTFPWNIGVYFAELFMTAVRLKQKGNNLSIPAIMYQLEQYLNDGLH